MHATHLLPSTTACCLDGVHICRQVPVNDVSLLNPILQVVAVAMNVEAHIALQGDCVGAMDCDATPVGAAAGRQAVQQVGQQAGQQAVQHSVTKVTTGQAV
jgi:hypothetical protein